MRVACLCHQNVHRSVLLAGLLRQALEQNEIHGVEVISLGLNLGADLSPDLNALAALHLLKAPHNPQRSAQPLTAKDCAEIDLILAVDEHVENIAHDRFQEHTSKIIWISKIPGVVADMENHSANPALELLLKDLDRNTRNYVYQFLSIIDPLVDYVQRLQQNSNGLAFHYVMALTDFPTMTRCREGRQKSFA